MQSAFAKQLHNVHNVNALHKQINIFTIYAEDLLQTLTSG